MMGSRIILVTGAAGFLGWTVARELSGRGLEVVGTSRDGLGMPAGVRGVALSLDDGGGAGARLIHALRPETVVHAAAMGDADACARAPERADVVNRIASGALARAAAEAGAWLLYTSTDLVFDGRQAPYAENAAPAPMGPYMASKCAGEAEVLAAAPGALVARLALLYGRAGGRRGCFLEAVLRRLAAGEEVPLFTDQFRTPLHVADAAAILADLVRLRPAGLLHVAGPDRVSRFDHAQQAARACGLDTRGCRPVSIAELTHLAPRPRDVSMVIDRLVRLLGRTPWGIEEGCRRMRCG